MKPFDYVNSINFTKKNLMKNTANDELAEKDYVPFLTNKSLSYFTDTLLYANEMNRYHHLDHRLQFDFFINIIKKKKRWSKWIKPQDINNLELIKQHYGYSNDKAKSVLQLFNNEQIEELKRKGLKGGRTK